jgi:iron complex transport system substrate-binding protein
MRRCSILFLFLLILPAPALAAEFLGKTRPPEPIKRVVSLAPNLTEIVFALGAGNLVVGVTRYDDWPPEVKKLPKVGGFIDPSIEAIVELKPDLVVCVPNPGGKQRIEVLDRLGIAVLVLPDYNLQDLYAAIKDLGKILRLESRAEGLVEEIKNKLQSLSSRASSSSFRPRVLMVYGQQPLVAAGRGSFAQELLELAGAQNAAGNIDNRYPVLSLEQILEMQPDIIIDASAGEGHGAHENALAFWKRWPQIEAVRRGKIFIFDSSLWLRTGPRLPLGLEKLLELVHPQLRR